MRYVKHFFSFISWAAQHPEKCGLIDFEFKGIGIPLLLWHFFPTNFYKCFLCSFKLWSLSHLRSHSLITPRGASHLKLHPSWILYDDANYRATAPPQPRFKWRFAHPHDLWIFAIVPWWMHKAPLPPLQPPTQWSNYANFLSEIPFKIHCIFKYVKVLSFEQKNKWAAHCADPRCLARKTWKTTCH